jgi:hypothetical protein
VTDEHSGRALKGADPIAGDSRTAKHPPGGEPQTLFAIRAISVTKGRRRDGRNMMIFVIAANRLFPPSFLHEQTNK